MIVIRTFIFEELSDESPVFLRLIKAEIVTFDPAPLIILQYIRNIYIIFSVDAFMRFPPKKSCAPDAPGNYFVFAAGPLSRIADVGGNLILYIIILYKCVLSVLYVSAFCVAAISIDE